MIEPSLLLALEAPDPATHLYPGFRPWIALFGLIERAGDDECGSARHLFPAHGMAHLRAARAEWLRGDRDVGPARPALRADGSVEELGDG